jgi:flagellar protein FlaD
MSEVVENQNQEEKPLEEFEIGAELTAIIERNILPPRIAQKIEEKIKERNIKMTKEQLYKLVEKIQNTLRTYVQSSQSEPVKKDEPTGQTKQEKKFWNEAMVQTTDMKKLGEAVEQLKERIKVIEEQKIEGVKGVTGKLVKTKDIQITGKTEFPEGDIQPLEQVPNDPESIVVLMKWLQYLVDKTGKNNLPDVLGYYVDIGWISDDVRLDLINYSKGITEGENTAGTRKESANLPTKDHLQSLLFIQKLKGIHLDERFIWRIDREIEKLGKSIEEYQQIK